MTTINTRIQLRNDDISAWGQTNPTPYRGEVALAKRTDGSYDLRIGDGIKQWDALSGSLQLSANQIIGLTQTINSLSTTYRETDDINKLSDYNSYANGDIAIETKTIAGDKVSKCAYTFNALSGRWEAMDGNYSADNVYMPENMTITEAFGKYTIPTTGSRELTCAGMTIKAFINDAFAQTKPGQVTQPSFSLATTATLTGEVGTTYNIPKATFKLDNIGSYQYGPATGISVAVNACTISCDSSTGISIKKNTTNLTANGNSFSTDNGKTGVTFTDSAVTYNYRATYSYGDGAIPKNNIGGNDPDRQIKGKTNQTKTCTCTATGKRKHFYGYRLTGEEYDIASLTSGNIRGLNNSGYSLPSTTTSEKKTNFTVPAHTKQIILASPHVASPKKIAVFNNSSLGAALDFDNGNAAKTNAVQVEGANSYTAIGYDIWYVTFGAELAVETKLAITWA